MKRALFSLAMLMTAVSLMAKTVKDFPVSKFNCIKASSAVEVQFSIGETFSVRAEGEEKDIEQYEVVFKNGCLRIRAKDNRGNGVTIKFGNKMKSGQRIGHVVFYVTAPECPSEIELSGASCFKTKNSLKGKKLSFDISGASNITCGAIMADEIDVDCSGASSIGCGRIEAKTASFDISGASRCNASVKADKVDVECSGASHCSLDVQCQQLDAEANGASSLTLSGTAKHINTDTSGMSSIHKKGLKIRNN